MTLVEIMALITAAVDALMKLIPLIQQLLSRLTPMLPADSGILKLA